MIPLCTLLLASIEIYQLDINNTAFNVLNILYFLNSKETMRRR